MWKGEARAKKEEEATLNLFPYPSLVSGES
jgi:hypothetical protein